jgi:hypothetical protein
MTKINQKVLDESYREHLDEQTAKEFREWVVYSAPEDVRSVLTRYEEKMLKRQDEYLRAKQFQDWAAFAMFVAMVGYGIYATVTALPLCR